CDAATVTHCGSQSLPRCPMRFVLATALLFCAQAAEPPLRFETTPTGQQFVAQLPEKVAATLPAGALTQEQGEPILTLSLLADNTKTPGPSMLGKYERSGT